MAKRSSAGGGYASNKKVTPGVRTGAPAREMSPKGVSQIGTARGNRATQGKERLSDQESIPGQRKPISVALGNELAAGVSRTPGGGRTVHHSGSQAQHGRPEGTPPAQGRDILSSFGPESKPRR